MSDDAKLDGRVAFIAGAGSRQGRAIAVALAEAGAELALATGTRDTSETFAVNSVANELWAIGRRYLTLSLDYRQPPSIGEAFRQAFAEFGRIDLVVSAGAYPLERPFAETPEATWRCALALNLEGIVLLCHVAGQVMREHGRGSILNVVSTAARGRAGGAAFAAAEAGVIGFSRSLALEWSGQVAVNVAMIGEHTSLPALGSLAVLLAGTGGPPLSGQVFEL